MVTILHEEHTVNFDTQEFEKDAQCILQAMGYADFSLNILLADNATIQKYNRDYRGKDEPTDILSFPFYPDLKPGERIKADNNDEMHVGDLVISLEYINEPGYTADASDKKGAQTINDLLRTLLCHGICHLLGYDHDTDETDRMMKEKEAWLSEKLIAQ